MNFLFKKILIISIFVFIFLIGIFCFFNYIVSSDINLETEKNMWSTKKMNEEMEIKVKNLFKALNINELKKEEKYYKERGIDIFGLTPLEEQIDMLKKATNCQLDNKLKNKFLEKKFKLFFGKGGPVNVDILYNDNLKKCALRLIGSDGLDVSLDNFNYILAFIDKESIYSMQRSFYKMGIFDFVDSKLEEMGYEVSERGAITCDNQCNKNTNELFNSLSKDILSDPIVKQILKIYDEMFLNL